MKYLKKSTEVLIGKVGGQNEASQFYYNVADYTAIVAMITNRCDGLEEEFSGICVTLEQLEQIRNAIDDYLSRNDGNTPTSEKVEFVNNFNIKAETGLTEAQVLDVFGQVSQQVKQILQNGDQQKQTQLVIDPKLVTVDQLRPEGLNSWVAKLRLLSGLKDFSIDGKIELSVFGSLEEEVRTKLDTAFHELIMACVNPDLSESTIPDIAHENQQPVNSAQGTGIKSLKFDLNGVTSKKTTSKKTSEKWEARIVYWWNGCDRELIAFGETEIKARTELYRGLEGLQDLLPTHRSSDTIEPENSKQSNETGDKDATQFKLNPSRVMSTKIRPDKWEARTRLFNGINFELVDLVATANSEEEAREELDNKFSNFARSMTNFIKFMSQDSWAKEVLS